MPSFPEYFHSVLTRFRGMIYNRAVLFTVLFTILFYFLFRPYRIHRRKTMKRLIAVCLLFALLAGTAAFADSKEDSPLPEEQAAETARILEHYYAYNSVLNRYTQAVRENWNAEQCYENDVNYLVATVSGTDCGEVGYCFRDVNADEIPELLIGCVGGKEIYAMFTLNGQNEPVQRIDAGERSSFYLEPDNCFVNFASGSAYSGAYRILMMNRKGDLYLYCALLYDFSADADEPWYYTTDDDWDVSNDRKMSTAGAEKAIRAYEENYVELPYAALAS